MALGLGSQSWARRPCYVEECSMKVVAFNGSARKDGNTAILVRRVFAELEKEGIETELVQLAGQHIHGCCRLRPVLQEQEPALCCR